MGLNHTVQPHFFIYLNSMKYAARWPHIHILYFSPKLRPTGQSNALSGMLQTSFFAINAITAVPSRAGRVCDCGNYYIAMFQAAAAAILGKFIVCLF